MYLKVSVVTYSLLVCTWQTLDVDDVDGEPVELDHEFPFLPDVEDNPRKLPHAGSTHCAVPWCVCACVCEYV